MRLLLDTHALLWWVEDEQQVSAEARAAIHEADVVAVSAATAWELSLNEQLGKLRLPEGFAGELARRDYHLLAVSFAHAWTAGSLPLHHRDPFDRMLVAQAQLDGYTIVTRDERIARYQVAVLAA